MYFQRPEKARAFNHPAFNPMRGRLKGHRDLQHQGFGILNKDWQSTSSSLLSRRPLGHFLAVEIWMPRNCFAKSLCGPSVSRSNRILCTCRNGQGDEISKINWFTPRQAACSEPGYFFWLFLDLLEQGIGKQLVYTDKEQWDKWPSGIHITLCHLPPPPVIRHIDRNGSILDMNF